MVNPKVSFPARKLPSYLKGLVDSRARADGHVQSLAPAVAAAREALVRATATLRRNEASLSRAHVARDACDTLLRKWNEAIDTDDIAPVHAWKGRYGERGALQRQVLVFVDAAGAAGVATGALADQLAALFDLTFLNRPARRRWVDSVVGRLKVSVQRGLVERVPATDIGATGKVWRRAQPVANSLDSLVQQAETAGLAIKTGSKTGARPK